MKVKAEGDTVILHDLGSDSDVHLTFKSPTILSFFYQNCLEGGIEAELWLTRDYDLSGGNVDDPD